MRRARRARAWLRFAEEESLLVDRWPCEFVPSCPDVLDIRYVMCQNNSRFPRHASESCSSPSFDADCRSCSAASSSPCHRHETHASIAASFADIRFLMRARAPYLPRSRSVKRDCAARTSTSACSAFVSSRRGGSFSTLVLLLSTRSLVFERKVLRRDGLFQAHSDFARVRSRRLSRRAATQQCGNRRRVPSGREGACQGYCRDVWAVSPVGTSGTRGAS